MVNHIFKRSDILAVTIVSVWSLMVPVITYAQTTLFDVLGVIINLVSLTIPLVIGLAILFFLWGLMTYILKADETEGRKSARQIMMWGIIIIFVMVSLWGLVAILINTFGVQANAPATAPGLPGSGGTGGGTACGANPTWWQQILCNMTGGN